jgi:isopropylmalate/homocitrate/citramalate synthase
MSTAEDRDRPRIDREDRTRDKKKRKKKKSEKKAKRQEIDQEVDRVDEALKWVNSYVDVVLPYCLDQWGYGEESCLELIKVVQAYKKVIETCDTSGAAELRKGLEERQKESSVL